MAIIERFHLIYFLLFLIFLSKNIKIVNSEVFKGNAYGFFSGIIGTEIANKTITDNFNQNKTLNQLQIKFSNNTVYYDDYLHQLKINLYKKYLDDNHFFIISSKSLFNKYSRYKDWEYDFTKEKDDFDNNLNRKSLHEILLPINKYIDNYSQYSRDYLSDSLYDEYKLNGNLYGLPVSATYDNLFYNKKLLKKNGIQLPEGSITWERIQEITDEYNLKNSNKTVCGLAISLNTEDDMISLFLEGLYSYSHANAFKDCKEYKGSNLNYRECGKKYPQFFYGDATVKWLAKMKKFYNNNIICKDSFDLQEKNALDKFMSEEALFFKGRTDSCYKLVTKYNKNRIGILKLPYNYTTYQSAAIVGNGSNKLKGKFKDIAKIIQIIGDYENQVKRMKGNPIDYSNLGKNVTAISQYNETERQSIALAFTPVFSYEVLHSEKPLSEILQLNDDFNGLNPIYNLQGLNPISLATAMRNPESASMDTLYKRIDEDIRKFLKDEDVPIKIYDGLNATWTQNRINLPFKIDEEGLLENSKDLNNVKTIIAHLYYYLNITHTKWLSGVGILNIIFMIIGNVYAFSLVGLILYNKNKNKMVKKAYPKLCITFIICISSNFDYALFHNGLPIEILCALDHYFLHVFTTVALLILIKRLWNILIIIKDSKTKFLNLKITRFTINTIIAVVSTFEVVMNVLWDIVSHRVPEVTELDNGQRIVACSSRYDMHFSMMLTIVIFILFIFVVILSYKIKRTHDYYDEYKAYMTTSVILIIFGVMSAILSGYFFVINFNFNGFEIVRSTFSFLLGIVVLSLIVLPKIVDALTGKSIFSKVYKSKGKYASSNSSFNKMLFNSSNMNVITFKDAEEEYKQKLFSEELVTPLDSGYKNRKPKNNSNPSSNNTSNYIGNPILENNIFSNSPSKEKDGSYLYHSGYDDIEPRLH